MRHRLIGRSILAVVLSLAFGCSLRAARIHDAAKAGDVANVVVQGRTPLRIAEKAGRKDIAEALKKVGAK